MKKSSLFLLVTTLFVIKLVESGESESQKYDKDYVAISIPAVLSGKSLYFNDWVYEILQGCYTKHSKSEKINAKYKENCTKALALMRELEKDPQLNPSYIYDFFSDYRKDLRNVFEDALNNNVHDITQERLADITADQVKEWEDKIVIMQQKIVLDGIKKSISNL